MVQAQRLHGACRGRPKVQEAMRAEGVGEVVNDNPKPLPLRFGLSVTMPKKSFCDIKNSVNGGLQFSERCTLSHYEDSAGQDRRQNFVHFPILM